MIIVFCVIVIGDLMGEQIGRITLFRFGLNVVSSLDELVVKNNIILSIVLSSIDFKLGVILGGEDGCDSMIDRELSELLVVDFEGGL